MFKTLGYFLFPETYEQVLNSLIMKWEKYEAVQNSSSLLTSFF